MECFNFWRVGGDGVKQKVSFRAGSNRIFFVPGFIQGWGTFATKPYRKRLQQVFNKLHQTEIACKIIQEKNTPNFLNKEITPNF